MAGFFTTVRSKFKAAAKAFRSNDLEPVDSSGSGRSWRTIFDFRSGAFQQDDSFLSEGDQQDVMGTAVVYACIRLLCWDIAKLPAKVCKLVAGIWEESEHQVLTPLIRRPNYYQGWIDFVLAWLYSYFIAGNAYIIKVREAGRIKQMIVLDPSLVQPMVDRATGVIVYRVGHDPLTPISDEDTLVPASEIIHHRYMAYGHPLIGSSLLVRAQMAAKMRTGIITSNADLATNNAIPPGLLIAPEGYTEEQLRAMEAKWQSRKSGRIAVVDAAFKFESLQSKFIDSQAKEFAEVSALDICAAAGVPPWKVGMGPRPTGDVEAINIIYYQDSLQLPIEHIEQMLDLGLDVGSDVYIMLDRAELFLLDSKTRAEVDSILVKGIKSPDECRKGWNLPPTPGGKHVYLQQQNYSLSALEKRDQAAPAPSSSAPTPGGTGAPGPADDAEDDDEAGVPAAASRAPALPWAGVYDAGREYPPGVFVTHKGSLWTKIGDGGPATPGEPCEDGCEVWRLAAKGGTKGRPVELVEA